MNRNEVPAGWDEERVQRVLSHYEGQTDDEAVAEDERMAEESIDFGSTTNNRGHATRVASRSHLGSWPRFLIPTPGTGKRSKSWTDQG